MSMKWTTRQQAAIDVRNANILVSAAAGSGKTAVLAERVFRRVLGSDTEEGISIDRFLIVTFTSAAAHEMKERIANKIAEAIETLQSQLEDEQVARQVRHLEKQLGLMSQASISTIHSFCLKTIKNYFNRLAIDPNIKVGNEADLYLMKLDIIEELLETYFEAEDNEAFLMLADVYGSVRGLEPLVQLILDVHTFSKSTIFPNEWLDEMKNQLIDFKETIGANTCDQVILKAMLEEMFDLEILYEEALNLIRKPDGPMIYEDNFVEDLTNIKQVTSQIKDRSLNLTTKEWEAIATDVLESIRNITFSRLKSKKDDANPQLKQQVKAYRDLAKKIINNLQEKAKMLGDTTLRQQTKKAGECMETLVEVIKAFDQNYLKAKEEKNLVDYNDLEHMCLQLLVEKQKDEQGNLKIGYTDIAQELADFYEEIYIDEYQDSNKVQETLLGSIAEAKANGPTRFMVGDMKQSIYRFRLANPLIFAGKYTSFTKYKDGEAITFEQRVNRVIDLSQNFRSRAVVLESINDLFEQTMSEKVGELAYDEDAKLKVGHLYDKGEAKEEEKACSVSIHLMETKDQEQEEREEDLENLKSIEQEAKMVAQIIADLLQGKENPQKVFDQTLEDYRRVEPRDIVILLRSVQEKASLFETALLEKGIGAYADVNNGFFDATEIQLMLALLQIIDNPRQDIPLLSVLRSPIVRCDFDELLCIRKHNEDVDFYSAMQCYIADGKATPALEAFAKKLDHYRTISYMMSLESFIAYLLRDTGYYRYVGMLPSGAKKKANLKLLRQQAEKFELTQGVGLFSFLQYLLKLKDTKAQIGEAKLVGENENLVRIMTIHKSKGLEFPVVFVCNTDKKFNNQDLMKNVLMHSELGFGPKYTDTKQHMMYETIPFHAIKEAITYENISEEMRVLYVALTRAKEKLFITGAIGSMDKEVERWALFGNRQTPQVLSLGLRKSPTYLNWIGTSLFAHSSFEDFRTLIGATGINLYEGKGKWDLKLWHQSMLEQQKIKEDEDKKQRQAMLEEWDFNQSYSQHTKTIRERLNDSYRFEDAVKLPVKVAVSELKKQNEEKLLGYTPFGKEEREIPSFIESSQQQKATTKGTWIHSVFEHLDLRRYKTQEQIEAALQRLVSHGKLKEEAVALVSREKLVSVAHSELQKRMDQAPYVWKEKAFVYLMPANEVDTTYPATEEVLVQGVVDTCFLEEDGLVVVDYKTDYIDKNGIKEGIERIRSRYQVQLDLYGRALGHIMNKPVKEKWIYLYSINQWIQV